MIIPVELSQQKMILIIGTSRHKMFQTFHLQQVKVIIGMVQV